MHGIVGIVSWHSGPSKCEIENVREIDGQIYGTAFDVVVRKLEFEGCWSSTGCEAAKWEGDGMVPLKGPELDRRIEEVAKMGR